MRMALLILMAWLLNQTSDAGETDTSNILRLMGERSSAHACPVGGQVLTAAHVADKGPYRWSDGAGNEGVVDVGQSEKCSDLATLKLRSGSVHYYQRAAKAPAVGDKVRMLAYDVSSKSKAFGPREMESKVIRIVAGHLFLNEPGIPGSSGSCVLNEAGEVVGINSGGNEIDNGATVGRVVGIYGDWLSSCAEQTPELVLGSVEATS